MVQGIAENRSDRLGFVGLPTAHCPIIQRIAFKSLSKVPNPS
jgi:hypothetical protein